MQRSDIFSMLYGDRPEKTPGRNKTPPGPRGPTPMGGPREGEVQLPSGAITADLPVGAQGPSTGLPQRGVKPNPDQWLEDLIRRDGLPRAPQSMDQLEAANNQLREQIQNLPPTGTAGAEQTLPIPISNPSRSNNPALDRDPGAMSGVIDQILTSMGIPVAQASPTIDPNGEQAALNYGLTPQQQLTATRGGATMTTDPTYQRLNSSMPAPGVPVENPFLQPGSPTRPLLTASTESVPLGGVVPRPSGPNIPMPQPRVQAPQAAPIRPPQAASPPVAAPRPVPPPQAPAPGPQQAALAPALPMATIGPQGVSPGPGVPTPMPTPMQSPAISTETSPPEGQGARRYPLPYRQRPRPQAPASQAGPDQSTILNQRELQRFLAANPTQPPAPPAPATTQPMPNGSTPPQPPMPPVPQGAQAQAPTPGPGMGKQIPAHLKDSLLQEALRLTQQKRTTPPQGAM